MFQRCVSARNSIHAQIYPPDHNELKPLIREGAVYNLSYFRVRRSGKYRPVDNDHMIIFTMWTSVEEVVGIPPAFPMYTYSLTPMEQLPPRAEDTTFFTNVIGVVTMLSNVSSVRIRTHQSESLKRTVTICSASGVSLDVVLWGEGAIAFPAERVHRDGKATPQTVIFVGTLVKSFADNVSLSGGSSCKWYINLDVPEAKALAASVENIYQPVKWDQHKTSNIAATYAAPEHMKISGIKMLHPFKYKDTEWQVTVRVQKVGNSWWYNACKKCLRTAKPFHDSFRCSEPRCGTVGVSIPRYKLCIAASDETGETKFIMFGRIAQGLVRKPVDTLIANNPIGFIPNEVTKLLEKVYIWNVSFTQNKVTSGVISFQVNSVMAEIDGDSAVPMTPVRSQSSSLVLSKGATRNARYTSKKFVLSLCYQMQRSHASSDTRTKIPPLIPGTSATPGSNSTTAKKEADANLSINKEVPAGSANKAHKIVNRKRTRSSPKKTAKKLFPNREVVHDDDEGCAGDTVVAADPGAETEDK